MESTWKEVYRGGNPQQFLAVQISKRCPDFHFISNHKSEQVVQKYVFTFSFSSKRKSSRPDFREGVHISVFDENQNLNTFSVQIWTGQVFRFQFSTKTQMWTPLRKSGRLDLRFEKNENVNTYFCTTCSDLRFEIKWKSGHLSKIWTARNCWGFPPLTLLLLFSYYPD